MIAVSRWEVEWWRCNLQRRRTGFWLLGSGLQKWAGGWNILVAEPVSSSVDIWTSCRATERVVGHLGPCLVAEATGGILVNPLRLPIDINLLVLDQELFCPP